MPRKTPKGGRFAAAGVTISQDAPSALRNLAEAAAVWLREERTRVGSSATENLTALMRELGYVSRTEYEELALRVAQLEHRLRLLEGATGAGVAGLDPASEDAASP